MWCEGHVFSRCRAPRAAAIAVLAAGATVAVGCGQELAVGSDILWTARFEGADLREWTDVAGGGVAAYPAPNAVGVSTEKTRRGNYVARLTIQTPNDGSQANAGLTRSGFLPVEAYYSAWYYLPRAVDVGVFWVIFKFRMRSVAGDPSSASELFDLNLASTAGGGMTLRLYDHRSGDIPLDVTAPAVPVGNWFQIEAYYRNPGGAAAPDAAADVDARGRLTFWLDGLPIVDVTDRPMAPTSWVAWDVVSVAVDLNPSNAVLFVDDCALSRTRVGPLGVIAAPAN